VVLVLRDVSAHPRDLDRYWKLMDHFKVQKPGLPAFYVSGRLETGWDPAITPDRLAEHLTVEAFLRDGCPRCRAAHPVLFEQLATRYPGYRFVERKLNQSPEAGRRLQQLSQQYRVQATSVPAVHLGGRLMVGFLDAQTSFRQWDSVLQAVTVPCPAESDKPDRRSQSRKQHSTRTHFVATAEAAPSASAAESGFDSQADAPPDQDSRAGSDSDASVEAVPADAPPPRPPALNQDPPPARATRVPETDSNLALPLPSAPASDSVTLPIVGDVRWRNWGLPAFTLLVGLIDGFNPCAMWVLLFLLSVLVNLQDRWKILAVAGTFVLVSGLAYLAFMAAWLNVFQLVGLLRPAQITLGLIGMGVGLIHIKDFFAFKQGLSLSIPESAKPGMYARVRRIVLAESLTSAVLGAAVLAVLVNIVELLCTAGLPAMYTGILTMQELSPLHNYVYLLLYIAAYMFDDALMVSIVVVALGRHKLQERGGRILKLISGLVVFALGAVMLFRPDWLV
jgi:hypothetical protein